MRQSFCCVLKPGRALERRHGAGTGSPIPALGDLSAQQLVARGQVANVLSYIEHIDQGGYA